jgi:RNA polymerase sigma-70 factor (ECF subfamily)
MNEQSDEVMGWPDLADPRTDTELLEAHVAGDPDAFEEIVRRHRDRLWAVAMRTTGNREDAADALQDALISAFRHADSFRGQAAVTTWLHRIVVNACLDRHRRAAARPTISYQATREDDTRAGLPEPADPHDDLAQAELRVVLQDALLQLPTDQRAAIVLVDVQGLPVEQAAEILEVAVGTIKSRCSRGRAKLAEILKELRNPTGDSGVIAPGQPSAHADIVPEHGSSTVAGPGSSAHGAAAARDEAGEL